MVVDYFDGIEESIDCVVGSFCRTETVGAADVRLRQG